MKKMLLHWFAPGLLILLAMSLCVPVFAASTVDHSKFEQLQKQFKSGPEVTKACLTCHTKAAKQIHKTRHWTWEMINPNFDQKLGKKNVLNNFCVATASNYAFCTTCHVGYGWTDKNFDFSSEVNVDCLVCHDTTGSYKKLPGTGGHPAYKKVEKPKGSGKFIKPVDLTKVAQRVGKTSRDSCGACHFYGGGGDGVKHGDMDSSMAAPDKALDVHMDALGLDFSCATCHKGSNHDIAGSRYAPTAGSGASGVKTCRACHGEQPHKPSDSKLNDHTAKIACQTCHIPTIARGGVATKLTWDWSTAGKLDAKGKPFVKKDKRGNILYNSKKGDFTYGENVKPEYVWFNGRIKYTLVGDKVNPKDPVTWINHFGGGPEDAEARIWPVKVFNSVQPYDPVRNTLVVPHLSGDDDTAYWKNFNWEKSIATGMDFVGEEFSGKVAFIKTRMAWMITHMVAPKEEALSCEECHSKNGRLKNLPGVNLASGGGKQ